MASSHFTLWNGRVRHRDQVEATDISCPLQQLRPQGVKQVTDLLADRIGVPNRVLDLMAEQAPKPLAQTVNGDLHGAFGHVQFCGQNPVRDSLIGSAEKAFKTVESFGVPVANRLVAQPVQDVIQEGPGPALREDCFGRGLIDRLDPAPAFGIGEVERNEPLSSTAFLSLRPVPFVGHVVLER